MEEHELYGMTLRRLRRTLGLTQKELGERCGLSASGIGMLERGLRLPSSKAQRRLRALLPSLPPRPKKPVPAAPERLRPFPAHKKKLRQVALSKPFSLFLGQPSLSPLAAGCCGVMRITPPSE